MGMKSKQQDFFESEGKAIELKIQNAQTVFSLTRSQFYIFKNADEWLRSFSN